MSKIEGMFLFIILINLIVFIHSLYMIKFGLKKKLYKRLCGYIDKSRSLEDLNQWEEIFIKEGYIKK